MDTETVLFLRSRVPDGELLAAIAEAFAPALDAGDEPLVVHYPQGFASGVSIPCRAGLAIQEAVAALSNRLVTTVLLEWTASTGGGSEWLLFTPGIPGPRSVQVVELRHGLDVAEALPPHGYAATLRYG